jgi:hypothetical protein
MTVLRSYFRRYPLVALALLFLTLALKVAVPSGYMVTAQPGTMSLTVSVCTGVDMVQQTIEIPMDKSSPGKSGHEKQADSPCAFNALGHATMGGADGFALAILLAFIVALSFRGNSTPPAIRGVYLRPPSRGPPLHL